MWTQAVCARTGVLATERVQAEIDATQTLLDATRTLQAAALACGTSTAPGVWDPVTSACRVGFALADVDECSSTESPCSGRTICVNTPGSFICAPDLNECLTNNGGVSDIRPPPPLHCLKMQITES